MVTGHNGQRQVEPALPTVTLQPWTIYIYDCTVGHTNDAKSANRSIKNKAPTRRFVLSPDSSSKESCEDPTLYVCIDRYYHMYIMY